MFEHELVFFVFCSPFFCTFFEQRLITVQIQNTAGLFPNKPTASNTKQESDYDRDNVPYFRRCVLMRTDVAVDQFIKLCTHKHMNQYTWSG